MKKWLIVLLAALLAMTASFALADTYSEDGTTLYYDTPYIGKTAEADVVLRGSAYARGTIVDTLRKGVKLTVKASKYASDGVASAATTEALPHRGTAAPARWVMSSAPACVWAVPAAAPTVTGTAAGEVAPVAYG